MKIWVISNCRPNSGWGTYVNNLYSVLGERARFVNLFGSIGSNSCVGEAPLIQGGSKIRIIAARSLPTLYFHSLLENIRNERKNGLIVHYAYNLLPPIGDINLDIVTIHDLIFLSRLYPGESRLKRLYSKQLLKGYLSFKNIITVSNSVKKRLQSFSVNKKIEVIHPPCPSTFKVLQVTDMDKKSLKLPTDKILILSPSNNKPWKNLDMIAKVMKILGDKFFLVRVGPGIGTGIAYNKVDSDTLNLLYNVCDVLLFPSLEEGFGSPIVEAMKTGLPAVVSDIEVFHEVGSEAVEYVNPFDANSIAAGIFRALDRKENMRDLGFRRSVLYTQDAFKAKMLSYYENMEKI